MSLTPRSARRRTSSKVSSLDRGELVAIFAHYLLTNTLHLLDLHPRTTCARFHLPPLASELLLMRWTPCLVRMPSVFL
jgi:hypothetical protein